MDEHIIPAIYRMVVKHFNDPSVNNISKHHLEDHVQDAEKWIDCWAGCAAVIVQNGRKVFTYSIRQSRFIELCVGMVPLFESRTTVLGAY